MRIIRIYLPFALNYFKSNYISHKSKFILIALSHMLSFLIFVFLWISIFDNSLNESINGFNKNLMIQYIFFSKIIEAITSTNTEMFVSYDLRKGSISSSLTKPINYKNELLFKNFGMILGAIFLFLPIYIIMYIIFSYLYNINFSFNFINTIFFIIYIILTFILNFLISLFFAALIFKVLHFNGLTILKKNLINFLAGAVIPISFFSLMFVNILSWLPFMYMRFYPTMIILDQIALIDIFKGIGILLVWIFLFYFLSNIVWKKMIRKVVDFGG